MDDRVTRSYRPGTYRERVYEEIPPSKGKRPRPLFIIIIAVVVVMLCLCVACALTLVGAELYASDVLTATASAPTPTPDATNTPIPTNTPLPTATPSVTPTPDPLGYLSPDEKSYLQGFQQQSQRWTEGRQKFDTLMANPNPSDGAWKSEIVGELTVWKDLANQARALPQPGRFQPAHERYLEAVERYDIAASLAIEGINNQDVVAFDQAKQEISAGDQILNEARSLVETLKQP